MFESMILGNTRPKAVSGQSVRLCGLSAQNINVIGVYELELYNKAGVNLCRVAGATPATSYSPATTNSPSVNLVNYPPSNTIDGNTTDWHSTCYIACATDGSAWLQYDFPVPITIDHWYFLPEGQYIPAGAGLKLQIYIDGVWCDIRGTMTPTQWSFSKWHVFTNLSIV
ncbi:hypothetical protein pEaSNUABM37_00112 [Erwinia phage pEa_SNUABM_37]|nr:hypothetical protein pEaSNUABM37_00112 [Erwinia phage pEa_SNUABM_37]QXO10582.1 hypothetical protein pEaSNUABM48_00112 [Erwinia phage pEa_SNUABM_48]